MFDNVMAVMQDDLVMVALPFFFAALLIEWVWARRQITPVYDSTDFWASMRVMVLTVFVDLIPKFLGIALMFVCYDISPLRKKALIRVNAKVLVGYDLEKMNMQIDEKARTLYLDAFPDPELLSVDDDIEYYDVSEGLFTSFSTSDYNALQKIAKAKIVEVTESSGLFEKAAEQKSDMLDLLELTLESIGWELKVKQQPVLTSLD